MIFDFFTDDGAIGDLLLADDGDDLQNLRNFRRLYKQ